MGCYTDANDVDIMIACDLLDCRLFSTRCTGRADGQLSQVDGQVIQVDGWKDTSYPIWIADSIAQ